MTPTDALIEIQSLQSLVSMNALTPEQARSVQDVIIASLLSTENPK
jgi:hypothetical protein